MTAPLPPNASASQLQVEQFLGDAGIGVAGWAIRTHALVNGHRALVCTVETGGSIDGGRYFERQISGRSIGWQQDGQTFIVSSELLVRSVLIGDSHAVQSKGVLSLKELERIATALRITKPPANAR